MSRGQRIALLALTVMTLGLTGCFWETSTSEDAPRSPLDLTSYRWTTDLRAEPSLFDQSQAPEALRGQSFALVAHIEGDRVAPDRLRTRASVAPVATEPRETVTIGQRRWYRVGDGPWRTGGEAFPAARAYFGAAAQLDASTILEAAESPTVVQLREAMASMPYREEQVQTGPARRYTLEPNQVKAIIDDPEINPFAILRTLPGVRIDIWVDQRENVLVCVSVRGDTQAQRDAFQLDMRIVEIEPAGLAIEPPR